MTDSIRAVELERKLEAERQRNAELQADLEKSRCWARAWKRAAKSELQVVKAIRNLRRRREAAGITEPNPTSNEAVETLKRQLAEAQRQIKFLERERQRWEENAGFHQERMGELSLSLEELEARLRERTGPNGRNGKAAEIEEK